MAQSKATATSLLSQSIQIYKMEPIGRLLLGRVPLPVIWFLFVFLYFGILLILHSAAGTPKPSTLGDIFRHPSANFYYPNLIGISFDLFGNPTLLLLLVFFQNYIPSQFIQLEQSGFIGQTLGESRVYKLCVDRRLQRLVVIIIPLLVGASTVITNLLVFSHKTIPDKYAVFLSGLGTYGRTAVLVQIIYVFLILSSHRFNFSLRLSHPDGCSGLAPFGKLALSAYSYLFIFAMIQAIGTTAGGGAFERTLGSNVRLGTLTFLWILFPVAFAFIFDHLIYKPHRDLQKIQKQYLFALSTACTDYHQQLVQNIKKVAEQPKTLLDSKAISGLSEGLEVLEVMSKLSKPVEDMHTWPIRKRSFQIIGVVANPLIPALIPIITEVVIRMFR